MGQARWMERVKVEYLRNYSKTYAKKVRLNKRLRGAYSNVRCIWPSNRNH